MTAKRRLVPLSEVKTAMDFLKREGLAIGAVDIRTDGVTFFPPTHGRSQTKAQEQETAYDRWKAQDNGNARPAHRSQAD